MVELASLLNAEPFSDRPASVCPALREFLHGYNDGLPDDLRQELYGLASDIVGSRAPAQATAWRAGLCIEWARSMAPLENVSTSFRGWKLENCGLAGKYSARAARRNRWCHRQTVAFIRWLAQARSPLQARERAFDQDVSHLLARARQLAPAIIALEDATPDYLQREQLPELALASASEPMMRSSAVRGTIALLRCRGFSSGPKSRSAFSCSPGS